MSTVQQLIGDALRLVGVGQNGELVTPEQFQDHMRTFNRMLQSFNIERLLVFTVSPTVYTLVPGQQRYTMGPGGTLDPTRPTRIEQAYLRILQGSIPIDRELQIVHDEEWASIGAKTVSTSIPTVLYNDGNFPTCELSLWPLPSAANQLVLYTWQKFTQATDINQEVAFPDGYEEMLVFNLAPRLAPEYGMPTPGEVTAVAVTTKASIKRLNNTVNYLRCDSAVLGKSGRSGFNYLTGDFGR